MSTKRSHLCLGTMFLASALMGAGVGAQEPDLSWGLNTYGMTGLVDMPTAYSREDGELAYSFSSFARQNRHTLTFQISPRLSAAFRYSLLYDVRPTPTAPVSDFRFDRSFSVHYRAIDEGRYRPAVAIGINDLLGTGIYAGEYVVMSKAFGPDLRASIGLGWGRLGSYGSFENPLAVISDSFKTRPGRRDVGLGGQFQYQSWFRGDAAFFGGIEWQATERLRLVAEYSSDDQAREDGAAFTHKSPFNFGLDWRYNDRTTVSAHYLYGSEIGVQLSYTLNPKRSRHGSGRDAAPPPILPRDMAAAKSWAALDHDRFRRSLEQDLGREGLELEGMTIDGNVLRVEVRNMRYGISAQAVGRVARVLTRIAPAEVARFEIVLAESGMPITSVIVNRDDVEELEFHPVAPDLLRVNTVVQDAPLHLEPVPDRYPLLNYGIEPYLTPSLFDPDDPLRANLGLALYGRYEPMPGFVLSGRIHQKIFGNLDDGDRPSNSVLPHVRSDLYRYFQDGDTTLQELTAAWYFRPGENLYGRVTVGYLETMFGGASAEILWKPQNSALALGLEVNHVRQRDFDQLLGFQDYSVTTGHVSAYYEWGGGYQTQLDVGRYLAGDVGATLTLSREFDNGWKIGAFATLTDVSAEEFGEGSFDKGILLTIPIDWVSGKPTRTKVTQVIRSIQRDGGAQLYVPGRLYETVRGAHATELDASWGRFWK